MIPLIGGLIATLLGGTLLWYLIDKFLLYIIIGGSFFIFLFIYQLFDRIELFEGIYSLLIGLIIGVISFLALRTQSSLTITIIAFTALGLFLIVTIFPKWRMR